MKAHIFSDIHLEFTDSPVATLKTLYSHTKIDADILILAGDIITLIHPDLFKVFKFFSERYEAVLYVPGNHEYYGCSIPFGSSRLKELEENVGTLVLDGWSLRCPDRYDLLGATAWFPPNYNPAYELMLNDFRMIKNFKESLPVLYQTEQAYLREVLREGDVLITHYLPTPQSISEEYKGDPLNQFFLTDMSDLILERKPKLAIHGHTHTPCDYVFGETRVFSNPLGYPKEWNNETIDRFATVLDI